jgi:hypothetical protein
MTDPPNNLDGVLSPSAIHQEDRRKEPRYPLSTDTQIEEPRAQAIINGRMTDLGMGGCYIDTLSVYPAGTEVMVRIDRDGTKLEAHATVMYSKEGMGMGLAFKDLTHTQQEHIYTWVEELSGRTSAPRRGKIAPQMPAEGNRGSVLAQLITLLMRKGVVTPAEHQQLLREIEKRSRLL